MSTITSRKIFSVIVTSIALWGAYAQYALGEDSGITARIDIYSDNIILRPLTSGTNSYIRNISWGEKKRRRYSLYSEYPNIPKNEWTPFTVSFMPSSNGKVRINLRSGWNRTDGNKKLNATWVYFDSVRVQGAKLLNGDFNEARNNLPNNWRVHGPENYVTNENGMLKGKKMLKVFHDSSGEQTIEVKKNQEVTITALVMPGEIQWATE